MPAISESVLGAIRVTMPGANSPPFASSQWHAAQRVSKTCLPGIWACKLGVARATANSHAIAQRRRFIVDPYEFYTSTGARMNRILLVLVAEDNLMRGASGVAVQNFNRMYGYDEKAGLW